ncbi:MAG: DNA repair protein RecO [Pseudomonadota bacterium]
MEWRAEAILLAVRRHGETAAIIDVLGEVQGRQPGIVRGGAGRRLAPILQPGTTLDVTWRARIEAHLGTMVVEPIKARAGAMMGDRESLAGLSSVTALCAFGLPERQPYPALFRQTEALLDMIGQTEVWPFAYLLWEVALLAEMGYGLDLSSCAVTGATERLAYVSPRSGRAVTEEGAGPWADRLLPLPACLTGTPPDTLADVVTGLRTTGYFLEHRLAAAQAGRPLPPSRARLVASLERRARDAGRLGGP